MGEEGIIVPVQIKREMCRDNVGNFEANPRPGLFIDEECWGCGLYYLCSYIDKFDERLDELERDIDRIGREESE